MVGFYVQHKSSTTHHADENGMTSPTQTIVSKYIPNPLIAEGLLKILRDLVLSSPPKFLTNFLPRNGKTTELPVSIFPVIRAQTCHVNSKSLTSHFPSSSMGFVKLILHLLQFILFPHQSPLPIPSHGVVSPQAQSLLC